MHVFDLPTPIKEALAQAHGPRLSLRVYMTASYREVTGFTGVIPVFGTSWQRFQFDLTSRYIGPLQIDSSRPIFPDGDSFARQELEIALANPDELISCLQSGSMVRLADISQGTIQIDCLVDDNPLMPVTLFKGRIIGPPKEESGKTTFTAVDTIWDCLRIPVFYEDFAAIQGDQSIEVVNGLLEVEHRSIDTPNGHFCVYNGVVVWDASGDARLRYTNSDPEHRDLKSIRLANRAKPGMYSIFFTDAVNYTLTHPDNTIYRGRIGFDLVTPYVTILASDWTTDSYATGVKIDFGVGVALKGNPVTIARNSIEKALLDNFGSAPGQTLQVRMDTAAWDAAERRFQSYTIYLSETNKDNKVWSRKAGNNGERLTPLNCLELAQKALDHVGCFLQMRRDGLISITTPFLDGVDPWSLTTVESLSLPIVNPQAQWNYLTVQYGEENGSFTAIAEHDLRVNVADEAIEKVVSAPYYKSGTSRYRAKWLMETYVRRYFARQQTISVNCIPQMAISLICGDFVRIISDRQPTFSLIFEVISISIDLKDYCKLTLVPIQQYEGDAFELCIAQVGRELLW